MTTSPPAGDVSAGQITTGVDGPVASLSFFHPKSNSLPAELLASLARGVGELSAQRDIRVIVLRSEGSGTFCAGASFDQLKAIGDPERGREFFMGFARVILAMRRCPVPIVARVHGKAVGGGVGLVAASDYALAVPQASVRLSEAAIGIGPFVVGPAVERRIGSGAFAAMALDAEWRDAHWALQHGLYSRLCDNANELDQVMETLTHKLAAFNPEAIRALKRTSWEGTDHWEALLPERAALSGTLVTSEFTRRAIASFEAR
jgi:methylglutaconyl-CoA hydratase